jgi:ATP-dependent DNA ligase
MGKVFLERSRRNSSSSLPNKYVMLHERLLPLAVKTTPLAKAPPRKQRFGGPLALLKVHWVRPEVVAEITYLSWSDDGLLRHTVFLCLREDKPAMEVRREATRA